MTDYSKLQNLAWLKQIPRKLTPETERLLEKIHGKPWPFVFWGGGRKGWTREMENARLSSVYVVQANQRLFDPEEAEYAPAVLLATNGPESAELDWMARIGPEMEVRLRDGSMPGVVSLLEDEQSNFSVDLPPEQISGRPFRLWVTFMDPSQLPGGCIPKSKVIPALSHGGTWTVIPAELYR